MASEPLLGLSGVHVHYPVGPGPLDRLRGRPPALLRAVDGVDLELAQERRSDSSASRAAARRRSRASSWA